MVDYEGEGKQMPDFNALNKLVNQELAPWAVRQQQVFTKWINNKVAVRMLKVENLFTDLTDGVILYNLLEVLSRQSLAVLGKLRPERNRIKKVANMNIVWKYLGTTVRLVGIGPIDIVDGNTTLTLGMIWSLIVFFMAKDLGQSGSEDLATLKRKIMEWLKNRTKHHPDINVHNFTDSLADGRAFMAVMEGADPAQCPYTPSADPRDNLRRAFKNAEKLFGVGSILDPEDPACCSDEKANITYLAELMKVLPNIEMAAPPKTDPRQQALDYAAAHVQDPVDRLKELCALKPEEQEAAAKKVAKFMDDAGLQGVHLLPANVAGTSGPYIVGERAGPAGAPTVLLYATYGTSADSPETAAQWLGNPFDATIDDGRVTAKGTFQDKANVVAPLAAVEALLKGPAAKDLPCTLRVLIGATPPPQAQAGDLPMALSDGLADFLRAHPGEIGVPDYVIVSEPGGSLLAPEKATVGIGCRGFATIDIKVSTFTEEKDSAKQGNHRSVCEYGGPLLDPGFVLATLIASLRDSETGELCAEALKITPDKSVSDRLRSVHFGEHHLRPHTGYKAEMPCAKESYVRDGVVVPAVLVEQLTLLPAVTVTSMTMSSGKDNGPVSAQFAQSASATLHLCLAPEQDVGLAIKALKTHINGAVPFGVEVEYSNMRGHRGWSTHPNTAIVEALTAARGLAECRRNAVAVGSPAFLPLPCAFAAALPGSKVVTFGVHDAEAKPSGANESVRTEDISDYVRTSIELLHYLAYGPPKPKDEPTTPGGTIVSDGDARTGYAGQRMDDLERRQAANKMRAGSTLSPPQSPLPVQSPGSAHRLSLPHPTSPMSVHNYPSPMSSTMNLSSPPPGALTTPGGRMAYVEGVVKGASPPPPLPPRMHGRGNSIEDMSQLPSRILEEINLLRQDPPGYAKRELEPLLVCYGHGGVFTPPYGGPPRVTSEGVKALEDALLVLKRAPPVPPLSRIPEMDKSSQDHAHDLGSSGQTTHTGSDGSKTADRINRYGQFFQVAGEVISVYETNAIGIITQMLINDGERTRQNRKSIIGSHFKVCGIAVGSHPSVGTVGVVTLAGGWGPKSLDRAALVAVEAGEQPTPEFKRVLESIPVPQVTDEVKKALDAGLAVELDYKPGEVKLTVKQRDGSASLLSCQWG